MSDIDNAAKPLAVPLIEGRGRLLYAPAQRTLSRWAILKTLALSHMEPERTIDQSYYDAFYAARTGDLPLCFEVFAARYVGRVSHGLAHVAAVDLREEPEPGSPLAGTNPYVALFSVGHLVLKVYGRDPVGLSGFVHYHRIRSSVCRIWPSRKPFVFPCGPTLGDLGLSRSWATRCSSARLPCVTNGTSFKGILPPNGHMSSGHVVGIEAEDVARTCCARRLRPSARS
jgi:hypothetical protein